MELNSEQTLPPQTPDRILLRTIDDFQTFEVTGIVPYIDAEDSNFYPIFYVANTRCFLIEARMRYGTAGGASAAVTIEKLASGTARGSGKKMLESNFDLTATANVTQLRSASAVLAGRQLTPGDAIALRASGTLTNARNIAITALFGVQLKDIPPGPSVSVVIAGI